GTTSSGSTSMPDGRARTQAQRILDGLSDEDRDLLEGDPLAALAGLGFTVRFWPERSIGGVCSVHGSYDPGPPPVLNVVETASIGRRVFTALHEYGHVLVGADTAIHDFFVG